MNVMYRISFQILKKMAKIKAGHIAKYICNTTLFNIRHMGIFDSFPKSLS